VIAVLADTHMPKGSRHLSARCIELIAEAEAVIHAGDLTGAAVLRQLESLCPVVHAVHGNVDEPALRRSLPESLQIELDDRGVLAVIHDAGPTRGRLARLRARFTEADAVVFGHSHLPLHEESQGFQIFNPGSPTERRGAPRRSMGLLRCEDGKLDFEHVWL